MSNPGRRSHHSPPGKNRPPVIARSEPSARSEPRLGGHSESLAAALALFQLLESNCSDGEEPTAEGRDATLCLPELRHLWTETGFTLSELDAVLVRGFMAGDFKIIAAGDGQRIGIGAFERRYLDPQSLEETEELAAAYRHLELRSLAAHRRGGQLPN